MLASNDVRRWRSGRLDTRAGPEAFGYPDSRLSLMGAMIITSCKHWVTLAVMLPASSRAVAAGQDGRGEYVVPR
jgi:hypothetical protein